MTEDTPIYEQVAATSVGVIGNEERLDLMYEEDSVAEVDMNVIMTDKKKIVEVQGTPIAGLLLLVPSVFRDHRGVFLETWKERRYPTVLATTRSPPPPGRAAAPGCAACWRRLPRPRCP